jgi:DNA-binding MarR family transcriptional regulator
LNVVKVEFLNLRWMQGMEYGRGMAPRVEGLHEALAADAWGRIWDFFFASRHRVASVAMAHGLNPGVMAALLALDADEPRPMRWVAEACHCDASNATWLVDRLEERGLVERRTPPEDRRKKTVALTPAGVELVEAIRAQVLEPPEAILALRDDELDVLRSVFAKLMD